jgi:hypothetical protein
LVKFSNMASILSISTKKERFISMKNKYFSNILASHVRLEEWWCG